MIALREAPVGARVPWTAPCLWALAAHAPLLFSALPSRDGATSRDAPAPSPEEKAVELHQVVGFTWLGDLFARKKVLGSENLGVDDLPRQVEGDRVKATGPNLRALLEADPAARAGPPGRNRTLRLMWVLCRSCWPQFCAAGACRLFYIFSGYLQPLARGARVAVVARIRPMSRWSAGGVAATPRVPRGSIRGDESRRRRGRRADLSEETSRGAAAGAKRRDTRGTAALGSARPPRVAPRGGRGDRRRPGGARPRPPRAGCT